MKTQASETLHLRLLIGGVVAILLGGSGIAAVKAWMPGPNEVAAIDDAPALRARGDAHVRAKCGECGVIESTREIRPLGEGVHSAASSRGTKRGRSEPAAPLARRYEVTVRMKDGASHVFTDANPANWRAGERVTVIAAASRSSD